MRARNIKPGFFQNELLTDVSFAGRLLFIGLWTLADREGRLEDRPKRIKMQLFAMDDVDVDGEIGALARLGFLVRYERDDGQYIQIVNFTKHQRPHNNESQSTIPPSIEGQTFNHGEQDGEPREKALRSERYNTDSLIPESPLTDTGKLKPEIAADAAPSPVTEKKPRPVPKPARVYERNPTWDALGALCGQPVTESEKSDFALTVKELDGADATPDEIAAFGPWWWQSYPDIGLTHRCLRKHFGRFRGQPVRPPQVTDIKNQMTRAILTTDLSDIRAELEAKQRDTRGRFPGQVDRPVELPADARRLGAGGQRPVTDVLPPSRRAGSG